MARRCAIPALTKRIPSLYNRNIAIWLLFLVNRITSSTGNRPDRRATVSARHDPEGATAPFGERECHLRGAAFGMVASTDPVREHNETP